MDVRRRFVLVLGLCSSVGCTVLSGADDLRLGLDATPDSAAVDGATADGAAPPALPSDAQVARLVCPRGLTDCNGERADGCEIDTQNDEQNCGACGVVCAVAGARCLNGTCGPPPPSCKALLAMEPGAKSGTYQLDPDGNGPAPAFSASCDMTTAGGGWTLVFAPTTFVNETTALDYTIPNTAVLSDAGEALITYRNASDDVVGTTAVFALPSDWRGSTPFRAKARDVNVAVRLNDAAPTTATLRYGYSYFQNLCSDDWDQTRSYGRLCIVGTDAPYYAGFAWAGPDLCSDSSKSYNAVSCGLQRRFTIGVR